MEKTRHKGVAAICVAVLTVLGVLVMAADAPDPMHGSQAGLELVTNGGFEGPVEQKVPVGWFKAMRGDKTIDLRAGIEGIPGRGNVAFIEQAGATTRLCNNWAQRLDTIPAGARVRLDAEVKTQNMPADSGFVLVQFWDRARQMIGGVSSQKVEPIGGTQDWKQVSLEFSVPRDTHTMIVRCGLAESGKIWFDNVSMTVIAPAAQRGDNAAASKGEGFEVTERSLRQLSRVRGLADGLAGYARQELGTDVSIRKEVFAQEGGRFQIVLHLDLSASP